jgi:hypothetical protein
MFVGLVSFASLGDAAGPLTRLSAGLRVRGRVGRGADSVGPGAMSP